MILSSTNVDEPRPVNVAQAPTHTNGHYWAWPLVLSVPAGAEAALQVSWPVPVGLANVYFHPPAGSDGDEIRRAAVLFGVAGQVAAVVDATTLVVATPAEMHQGFFLEFPTRAAGLEHFVQSSVPEPGVGWRVTVSAGGAIGAPASLPAGLAAGDPVAFVVRMLPLPIRVAEGFRHDFGLASLRGAFIPAGAVLEVRYRNNGASAKTVSGYAEVYY